MDLGSRGHNIRVLPGGDGNWEWVRLCPVDGGCFVLVVSPGGKGVPPVIRIGM